MKSGFCRLVFKNKELIMAIFASAIVAFLFLVNSPLHPWRYGSTLTDSSVFKTVALMMEKGYMPYRDSFDHKGPLLYVINYYGMKIAYYRGVWFFEFVFLMTTVFLFYKIARLVVSATTSVLVALTAFSMLFDYFGGGNYTEEYAMTFIAIGIYIFLDYLLNNRSSRFRIFLSGFLMGSVCLLRANMIAVWIVFCTAIFFLKIAKREWKQLRQFVLWFVAGFLMIVVPFVIWLAVNDALSACIADYLFFNMQYTSSEGGASFSGKCSAILKFSGGAVWIMAFVACFYNIRKKWFVHTSYIVYMLLELTFLGMSGKHPDHYGMVLIPAVVYPLGLIIENVENLSDKEAARVAKMLISIYIVSVIIVPASIGTLKAIPSFYENRGNEQPDDTARQVSDVVLNLTTEDDAISVYGNWDIIYVLTQRRHATKYSYQDPIGQVMPEIMEEYMEQLEEELPPIIVVSDGHYDDCIQSFLEKHEYSPVWPEDDEGLDCSSSVRVFFHPAETE